MTALILNGDTRHTTSCQKAKYADSILINSNEILFYISKNFERLYILKVNTHGHIIKW